MKLPPLQVTCALAQRWLFLSSLNHMPAPRGKKEIDYPEFARYDLQHNAGDDFVRMLGWCTEASEEDFRKVFAGYARNPLAVLLGGAAVEGYINYAGHALIPNWSRFINLPRSVTDKLRRVFSDRDIKIDLGAGIYQQTTALIKFRGSLAHPRFVHHVEERDSPPPTIFDHTDFDYPAARGLADCYRVPRPVSCGCRVGEFMVASKLFREGTPRAASGNTAGAGQSSA